MGKINPNSLANLRPNKKGECRNPWGRSGKDGNGGFSLKTNYQTWLSHLSDRERDEIWKGLYAKAIAGDPSAIKLLVSLNNENPDFEPDTNKADGTNITIVMPNKNNVDSE